jgi:hypothetical protein
VDGQDISEIPADQHDITQAIKPTQVSSVYRSENRQTNRGTHQFLIGKSQTAFHGESTVTSGFQAYLPELQQASKAWR